MTPDEVADDLIEVYVGYREEGFSHLEALAEVREDILATGVGADVADNLIEILNLKGEN